MPRQPKPVVLRTHAQRVEAVTKRLNTRLATGRIDLAAHEAAMANIDARAAREISAPERRWILSIRYCEYCRKLPAMHVDHVIPVSKGGTGDPDNLKAACPLCNLDKFDLTMEEWQADREGSGKSWPPDWQEHWRNVYQALVAAGIDPNKADPEMILRMTMPVVGLPHGEIAQLLK